MNRIAIFVEGQTEQIFIEKLLQEIAGKKNIAIEKTKARFGRMKQRRYIPIEAFIPNTNHRFYALIVDLFNR